MKGINIFEVVEHVSEHEDDPQNPTVWELGCIDQMAASILDDMATEYEVDPNAPESARAKTVFHFNRKKIDLVRLGLKGFRNFIHPQTGRAIEFRTIATTRFGNSRNVVSDEVLKLIPGPVMDELAQKIESLNRVTKEEEKNS